MFKRLFASLFSVILFVALLVPANAIIIGDKITYLMTDAQISLFRPGVEYATLSDPLEFEGYDTTVFWQKRVVLVRGGRDLFEYGATFCPELYPNGVPCYIPGPGADSTLYDWIVVPAPSDPLAGVPSDTLIASVLFRKLVIFPDSSYGQQQLQALSIRGVKSTVQIKSLSARPVVKTATVKPVAKTVIRKK